MSNTCIVVGGGLAGLSCAHTLLERGANVLLLDKNGFMGGNSTKATSGINGAGTATQQELGIPDSAKIFFEDTKRSARDLARPPLIKVLAGKSGDAVNWLQDKFALDLSKVARLGGHSQPRTHRGNAQFPGMVITYAQLERLEDLAETMPDRVKIVLKARVTKLIQESGAVIGVEYEKDGKRTAVKGPVILATGGYAADFTENSLLKKYRPEYYNLSTTNGDHCTGDGHKMAIAIGASSIDMEKVQVHPTGLVDPKDPDAKVKFLAAEALRGCGGLLLDNEGQRFADELGHRDYVTGRIWDNGKYPIRLVLNGQASNEIEWHCKHYVGRGLMKRFESGEALAKEIGIEPQVLKMTFDDYNLISSGKAKDPFGKQYYPGGEFKMNDFFHVAVMQPVLHYTMGGLEIDDQARVLGSDGRPLPGLFAAGEVAGGVHGANRLGGSSLLGCVVFGRVSGDTAAAYVLQNAKAADRLAAVAGHLIETKVKVDPSSSKVSIEFSWADGGIPSAGSPSTSSPPAPVAPSGVKSTGSEGVSSSTKEAQGKVESQGNKSDGEYTIQEVSKHNTENDVWVVVEDQVLDVTKFLPEHPGGAKAILLYAGKDATEEFLMLHDPKVIPRYAPDAVIGKLKK